MFCQKCGTKIEENYKCCPVCAESLNRQIISKNEDKQGCFGFFSGCVTVPLAIIGILIALTAAIQTFEGLSKNKLALIPVIFIIVAVYVIINWDMLKEKFNNLD